MTPEQQKRNEEIDRLTKELYDRDKTIESLRAELAAERVESERMRTVLASETDKILILKDKLEGMHGLRAELAEAKAKNDVLTRVINGIGYEHEKMAQMLSLQSHNAKLVQSIRNSQRYNHEGQLDCNGPYYRVDAVEFALASQPDHELRDRVSGIEAEVCADIAARQAKGIEKYGVSVADNPLALREWLQHAYEETLDQAVYLKRAILKLLSSL